MPQLIVMGGAPTAKEGVPMNGAILALLNRAGA